MKFLFALVFLSLAVFASASPQPVPQEARGIGCTICTLIVGYAEDYLGSNATLAEIETFLNSTVCGLLPSFLQGECAALVDEYAPQIAQRIFSGFPASVICHDIGLCTSVRPAAAVVKPQLMVKLQKPVVSAVKPQLMMKLKPAVSVVKPQLMMKLKPAPITQPRPQGQITCTICTLLVGYAEDYLGSNATLAQIETFLNTTVCGLLPSFLQGECATIVDQYAPQIAQRIFQGYPASVVCKDVGLCSSAPTLAVAAVMPSKLLHAEGQITCTVCTLIVGFVEDFAGTNATLTSIEHFLNHTVCGLLPSFLKGECDNIVETYAPRIAQKILQGFPASVVCKDVGLCSSVTILHKVMPTTHNFVPMNKRVAALRK